MFKIPNWDDGVPKNNDKFEKRGKMKEKKGTPKNKLTPETPVTNKNKLNNNMKKKSRVKIKNTPNINNVQNKSPVKRKATEIDFNSTEPKPKRLKGKKNVNIQSTPLRNDIHKYKGKSNESVKLKPTITKMTTSKTKNNKKLRGPKKINSNGTKTSPVKPEVAKNGTKTKQRKIEDSDIDLDTIDTEEMDAALINSKIKKLNDEIKNEDKEELLFIEKVIKRKKEMFKRVLENNRRSVNVSEKGNKLRERMLERLKAAQFRFLNEKLYTSSGSEAQKLFQSDPAAFQTYHEGYQQQLKKWPVNPLDVIVKKIAKMPKSHTIADMGCGEAALSKRVAHSVRSFDLVAAAPGVEACDMAHTPLLAASVDVVVYCLALMGTELSKYLVEANRVLKTGGQLLIAEVESRFDDVDAFAKEVQRLGFKLKSLDKENKVFFFMQFVKVNPPPKKKLPVLSLKPCLYKKR